MAKSEAKNVQASNSADSPVAPWRSQPSVGVSIASGITFSNVSYQIGKHRILDDISLEVNPGQVLCLLGPSGSGKTSLLRVAAGLLEGNSGTIQIDNRVISGPGVFVPPEKRGVGLVFQDYALFPHMTLLQNVEFGLTALSGSEAREQAFRVLARVGLEERADQYPGVLSGGEQQRVALARALAPRPGILLMDEPFSGLDSRLRETIREQSLELLRETRSTAIIVTHDAEEALRVGDHIALIRDGKLVQQGSARDLYHNPVNLFAAGFFSEINVIPAEIRGGEVVTVFGSKKTQLSQNGTVKVAIRCSDINVVSYDKGDRYIPGRIASRRFLGTSELLDINLQGLNQPVQVRVKSGEVHRDEKLVRIAFDPELMMIFGV